MGQELGLMLDLGLVQGPKRRLRLGLFKAESQLLDLELTLFVLRAQLGDLIAQTLLLGLATAVLF